ncbi:stalk domain-containing protein [Paenibacillus silvae]|uniref:stalk domain-containing protein n=1 Tax=Paenibacillus silvae TaxID=1325358 RepID=UPI002002D62A|nr:stalk domain-containing protein [Paenibacillus silvae]MCK6075624.1 copper amine oxidase N-terminal domain-containing protein [Paenibacillus silvae]MCK6150011.1 copper amine oxidase N-terminal domain-containing protein [Paenibacillus silvae]MCK6268309.1 copper amine oxidase N-terminal domain-containing protein [Paenibacillus silvae]
MKKSWLRVLSTAVLAGALLAGTALPVWASDELVTSELRVKAGSTSAFINGKKQNITKPLVIQGVTMVPVGVFKKAFGSEIVLEKNDVIKIKQGPHVAALTINSPIAWIDGIKVEMGAAPKMVNGVLMVPLRPVATGIGATIAPNSSGEIVIRLLQTGEGTDDGGIDLDKGKTRIGNSYYGWSIHYPADLLVLQSSEQESMMTFGAADESYYLEVYVSDQNVALDADDLLTQLVQVAKQSGDTILDRKAVAAKNKPYARVVVKDMDGLLWELRQYVHDGRQYDVYLADYEATNYKDLGKHASLLNSFEPSYAQSDRTIKDLSTVEDGMRAVWNEDYGIGLTVPAGWSMDNKNMVYEGEDGAYLQLRVTSAKAGATVKDWSDQLHKWMSDTFTPESYEQVGSFKTEIYGETAEVNEFRYNFGAGWQTEFDVLLQKNGYRYYVEYTFPEEQKDDRAWFESIMKSIEIEFEMVEDNFGQLDEDPYLTDKTKTITRTSKRYHYSVDIPRYWTPYSDKFESSPVIYTFTGGELSIAATEDKSIEMTVSQLREAYAEAAKTRKSFNLIRSEELTFAGVPAFSFTYHESDKGVPYTGRQIVFEKNGTTYTITTGLNDANRTQVQADMLEKAVNSFTFIK